MKKIIKVLSKILIVVILLNSINSVVHADTATVKLTIRSGNSIILPETTIPLQPVGTINLNDSNGNPHSLNADSVLSVLNDADILSTDFSISNLIYYDSYGSFYLKCITDSTGNECDNWQYALNNSTPGVGMDKDILVGGENIYIYFGQNHKITLSSNSITTTDTLTVNTQNYHYQDNTWIPLTGVTIGLTQPDPNNPFTPLEVKTATVDANGQATFSSIPVGSYNVGIKEDYYFPTESLTVTTPPPAPTPEPAPIQASHGGGAILLTQNQPKIETPKKVFDTNKAFDFITSQQKENGSFGEDLYTDWSTLALSTTEKYTDQKNKIIKYLSEERTNNYQLTDYERHSMALMALGLNPYNINGENYIKKITDSFDGKQFGDIKEDNDDIFALIVLQNAGFSPDEKIINDDINFILSKQQENGSWDNSVDMTSSGIEALSFFNQNEQVKNALVKARSFLEQNQKEDGGWGNVSSTTWAIEGILAIGDKPENWIKNSNNPLDYLVSNQDTDGGIKNNDIKSKFWETTYTVTALSGKTWNQIMQKFEKPKEEPAPQKIEEKLQKQLITKTITKKITQTIKVVNPENEIKKLSSQNTATVINSLGENNKETATKSWLRNFLDKVLSIF